MAQNVTTSAAYNKWLHAVLNVETRTSQMDAYLSLLDKLVLSKKISFQQQDKFIDSVIYLPPFSWTGTAVFLEDKGHHYLLTARHVLAMASPFAEDTDKIAKNIILIENDSVIQRKSYSVNHNDTITIVNNPGMLLGGIFNNNIELNPYLFTNINDDIAIICLDCYPVPVWFLNALNEKGFKPLHVSDFDTTFSLKTGTDIFTIGFPESSVIGMNKMADKDFESNEISVPVISHGVYSGEYPLHSNYFDAKMFVYHGFSGAPIIGNGKIVGLVSGGEKKEFFETGNNPPFKYFIENHSKFIKSTVIIALLRRLEYKVAELEQYWKNGPPTHR